MCGIFAITCELFHNTWKPCQIFSKKTRPAIFSVGTSDFDNKSLILIRCVKIEDQRPGIVIFDLKAGTQDRGVCVLRSDPDLFIIQDVSSF